MYTVDSVISINTDQQPYPYYIAQKTGQMTHAKDTPRSSFLECFESHIQQARASAMMTNQEESQKIGILMGLYPPLWVLPRPEMKLTVGDNQSESDM